MKRYIFILSLVCFTIGTYAKIVTLIPDQTYEVLVPLPGVTAVSRIFFDALTTEWGYKDRIVDAQKYELRSFVLFSCDQNLERGKIFNITNDDIVVHVKYFWPHDIVEEDIHVKPRTFSRILSGGWPQKIVCTF